jgi:iron complex outermembrane receptor protein
VTRSSRWCVLWLLIPALAFADARQEAKKRFRIGMTLINDGRLDEGIDQLLEAYSIKPHPNVLFNIAKAYEAAGRPSDALVYYRRYLDTEPADATPVRQSISRLEAQLPRREEPRPKEEPRRDEPRAPAVDAATVAKLNALAERLEAAVAKAEAQSFDAEKKEPKVESKAAAEPAEEITEVPYEETVVTASRRAQSTLEAPNATTVITAEEIRLSGATTLPELLRRVPGAEVMAMGIASYNVSFRGFNQRVANKVLVLLDGRTEYQDFLGITMWPAIPINLDEIERIEVIRGPGSALYGANAMLGVINIITRAPGTGPRSQFSAYAGNGNSVGGDLVASGGDKLRYRASVGYQQADKWSRDYDDHRADVLPQTFSSSLGLRSARGNLTTRYDFTRDISVSAAAGVNRFYTEIYPIGLLRNFYIDALGGYAQTDLSAGPVKMKLFWNHLAANAGPQYAPVGQRSLETNFESNVFDAEALFQKEFSLAGTHRFTAGVSSRLKRLSWTYMAQLQQELHAAAFLQEEWRPFKALILLGSYRVDRHPLLDNGNPGYAQSPRLSVLWQPTEGQALRASVSTAFREPTFLESYMDIRTPVPGVNGASVLTEGERRLKPERLLSFEVGWRGELARLGLEYDLALYWNTVSDLIALSAVNPVSADQAFDPRSQSYLLGRSLFYNDRATYTARGAELGLKWSIVDGLDVRLSTALQDISSSGLNPGEGCGPCTQAPALKLFAGVSYRTPLNLDLSLDAAYVSSTTWIEREPAPEDPTRISNVSNALPDSVVINARAGYRLLKDKVTVALVGSQLGPTHAEHPFGNLVNRRVFATLTVVP